MKTTPRALVALALGAGLALTSPSAHAERAGIHDRTGDSDSRAVDMTRLDGQHQRKRVRGSVRIPHLTPRRLSATELLVKPRGKRNVYAVTILRDRQGEVVEKSLSWRPLNDPIEPTRLPCDRIGTSLRPHRTAVSVATSCLTRSRAVRPVKIKMRTVDGTIDREGPYYDDQTRFTRFLQRGRAHAGADPVGRVMPRNGLVVRRLPTAASARQGTLRHGQEVPLSCRVTGSVVHRHGDQDADLSNLWYRLPGAPREWISALYVRTPNGAPRYCGDGRSYRGRVTASMLVPREAPTRRANAHGGLPEGERLRITCKLHAQAVRGNDLWYNLPHGLWVSARYVANIGSAPAYCTG